jgi:hypothetical protein
MKRFAVAIAMLLTLAGPIFTGACEAQCILPAAQHGCCPAHRGTSRSASATNAAVCPHLVSISPAYLVTPAGAVSALVVFVPLDRPGVRSFTEREPLLVTASPPRFQLRI